MVLRRVSVLLPCLVVLRPWRYCSTRSVLLVFCAPAVGAGCVAALAPYGDGGAISLGRWGYFSGIVLATAAFAPNGRAADGAVSLVALLLTGLQQFAQGWLAWWGGGTSVDGPMLGTIYSANPFGSLVLAFALMAAAVAVLAPAPLRRLGMLVAPVCATAVVLSAARAAMLLLVCGVLVLALIAVRVQGVRGLGRCTSVVALSWLVLTLSTSSLVFPGGQDPLDTTTYKQASGQTLGSTSSVRLEFWNAAAGEFRDFPLLGGGNGSYPG